MAAGREIRVRIRGIQYPSQAAIDRDCADSNREGRDGTARDNVRTSAAAENPEPIVTVQEVEASYFCRAGAHYLFYEEQSEGFGQILKTRVKRRGQRLEINRQGPMGSSMVFEPGKIYRTEYATPFGILLLDILTETVEVIMSEESPKRMMVTVPEGSVERVSESANSVEGGSEKQTKSDTGNWKNVKVRYTLENQGDVLGKYELYIESI